MMTTMTAGYKNVEGLQLGNSAQFRMALHVLVKT